MPTSCLFCRQGVCTFGVNSNRVHQPDTSIGSSLSSLSEAVDLDMSRRFLATEFMQSSPEAPPPTNTYGRMRPESPTLNSNLAQNPSNETTNETGTESSRPQSPDVWTLSTLPYWFVITALSEESIRTTCSRILSLETLWSIGAQLDLASPGLPGTTLDGMLILRIPGPSFGMGTRVKRLLSLMNLEEQLTSLICCDGQTVILSSWKSRDPPPY